MENRGLIIGKGWYPIFKTKEIHIFYFNNLNKIERIEYYILSGHLSETYEEVINSFVDFNNRLRDK